MADGLPDEHRALIRGALANEARVTRAVLYGSRALGTSRDGSDIDLALEGPDLDADDVARLAGRLDELPLPYRFDLTVIDGIANPDLREHIARHGVVFWRR